MATYFTDFSGQGVGSSPPTGFTVRGDTGNWSVVTGPAVRHSPSAYDDAQSIITMDAVGSVTGDVELFVEFMTNGTTGSCWAGGALHASSDGLAAYISTVYDGTLALVGERAGGAEVGYEAFSFTWAQDTLYSARLRREGNDVKMRIWASSGAEPGTWNDTYTDATLGSGYVGLFGLDRAPDRTYYKLGVGTGGDTAPSSTATASELVFTTQPTSTIVGDEIADVIVAAQDGGVTDTSYTTNVVISLQTGSGTLSGTLTQACVAGVATFSNLSIDTLNTGAVLRATSGSLTLADSDPFNITAGGGGGGGSPLDSPIVD